MQKSGIAWFNIVTGIFVFAIGLMFAMAVYFKSVKPVQVSIKNSVRTYGVISGGKTVTGYVNADNPMVRYIAGGAEYERSVRQGVRVFRYRAGERIPIYYRSTDPDDVMPADFNALYGDAVPVIGFFAVPIMLFGLSILILAILKRDSFFNVSRMLEGGIPASVKTSSKLISGLCAVLCLVKLFFDIPAAFQTRPYLFMAIITAIVLNICSFLMLLRLNFKKHSV